MGACGSTPSGCVKVGSVLKKKKNHSKPRRATKTQSLSHKVSKVKPCTTADRSYSNPTFQPNVESWFDTNTAMDSDCDDEFYSVQDDVSQIGSGSISTVVTPRYSDQTNCNGSILVKSSEKSLGNSEPIFGREVPVKGSIQIDPHEMELDDSQPNRHDVLMSNAFARCLDQSVGRDDDPGSLHNCGRLSSAFLPCLACTTSSSDEKNYLSPRSPSTRKRASLKRSFKWREGQSNSTLLSPRSVLRRPIAGSQVPCCPLEKNMSDCWSHIEPNTFRVRGPNYFREKKKELAPNYAAFYPFGVDVFLSPRKINHIARFVELPAVDSFGEVPPILVVNVQIPLYPATIFQNEYDGEGMSLVLYFRLSEKYSEELPVHFQDNIRKLIDDEMEKIRGFPLDTYAHFRERLKILGRVANVEDLHLSATERKLINNYNEKPVLSRPQHEFYLGENYFEIDLDMHRFSYIARKGIEAFQDKMKHCVLDFGLAIQETKPEDLPEHMLCCIRLKEVDYSKYYQLGF